jgi:cytochrome P450
MTGRSMVRVKESHLMADIVTDLRWDPYDVTIANDPYPVYRRLRNEAPLYYNEEYDFWALSQWDDIEQGLADHETFISGRGAILELIKMDLTFPPGVVIFEDPPVHNVHRRLMAGVFTPRKVAALEAQIREFTQRTLDPLVGSTSFDVIKQIAQPVPMKTIAWLLGIPDDRQEELNQQTAGNLQTEAGKPMAEAGDMLGSALAEHVEWRMANPGDDIMTMLIQAEFEDETGRRRHLSKEELQTYCAVIGSAGSETTNRLIGWIVSTLAEHPDQRKDLVDNPELIPNAVEETLRYQPPAQFIARYAVKDTTWHGRTVPAGSVVEFLVASGNRDERRFPNGDTFDVRRSVPQLQSFGRGIHFCLGASLARLEARVVLEELLLRFPAWDVDLTQARLSSTSTVRGWESLPITVR